VSLSNKSSPDFWHYLRNNKDGLNLDNSEFGIVATPAFWLLGLRPRLRLRFIFRPTLQNANLFCIFVPIPTSLIKVNSGFFRWAFVTVLIFSFHVAGDLNKKIPFVVGVLLTSFARALLGLIRYSSSCPLHWSIFVNTIHIRFNIFWSNGFVFWIPNQWTVPIRG